MSASSSPSQPARERMFIKSEAEVNKDFVKRDARPMFVLEEALQLTTQDRNCDYGPPDQDFARSAAMMTILLKDKLRDGEVIEKTDVARMAICIKLSRSIWMNKRDNWVDIAGYAACAHYCENGEW